MYRYKPDQARWHVYRHSFQSLILSLPFFKENSWTDAQFGNRMGTGSLASLLCFQLFCGVVSLVKEKVRLGKCSSHIASLEPDIVKLTSFHISRAHCIVDHLQSVSSNRCLVPTLLFFFSSVTQGASQRIVHANLDISIINYSRVS